MSGGGGSVTVGYRYYMGLHIAICAGPVDSFLELRAGDRSAWAGNQTASGTITVDAPTLFGGDQKEGGLWGQLDVMMGEATQGANGYLLGRQGAPQPAYRGLLGLVFRQGLISANNPYIKPWAAKVFRALKGWQDDAPWYPAKAVITLPNGEKAANPAHIVYECLTNVEWGMGGSVAQIDDANFKAAADTFYSEGMGLCMIWLRQDQVDAFIGRVLAHCGAVLSEDRRTGLFQLQPIRGGYDADTLPTFGPSQIVALEGFERPSPAEATNEVIVVFNDVKKGERASVSVQNLANIQSQGGIVSVTKQYPGIPTADLATRVALRDLTAVSSPLARGKLRINRTGYNLKPGSLFRLNLPKLGISGLVLRVLAIDSGSAVEGEITIEAAEDVFSLPSSTYVAQQPGGWVDPSNVPQPSPFRIVREATRYELQRAMSPADFAILDPDAGFVSVGAARPSSDAISFRMATRPGTSGTFDVTGRGDFVPYGTLQDAISKTATAVQLAVMVDLDLVEAGGYAQIDDEIVRIDAVNQTTGALTIGRGVMDTVAATHAQGARVFFLSDFIASDNVERVGGDVLQVKILPRTGRGELALASAPIDSFTFDQRHARPYPPGALKINALPYPEVVLKNLAVSWAHRNRLQQNLEGDESGNIGPEAGVGYGVEIVRVSDSQVVASTSTSSTAWTAPTLPTDDYLLRVWSVRDGLASLQRHEHPFVFVGPQSSGWGFSWGSAWGGPGAVEINLRSVFEVDPHIAITGQPPSITQRFIRADGTYFDAVDSSTMSGGVSNVAWTDAAGNSDEEFAWHIGSAAYDATTDRFAVMVHTMPGDGWSKASTVQIYRVSAGALVLEREIVPTFSTGPSGIEIMQIAAANGFLFVRNYDGTDLQKFSLSTGALVASRVASAGTFGAALLPLAADATSVANFDVDGVVHLFKASDLTNDGTITPSGTFNLLSSVALVGGEVVVTVEEALRRYSKAGSLIASHTEASTAPSISRGSIQQFGRYVAAPKAGGGRIGFDTLNSWAVVSAADYSPP